MNATRLINQLQLLPHPEGGFYKETYRSGGTIKQDCLPKGFTGDRHFSTSIYYLLERGDFSAFHRIKSDEGWHFYAGDPLIVLMIDGRGIYSSVKLGSNILAGELFQFVVAAQTWFASEPAPGSSFCLVGCTVSPGFDFADFEMAQKKDLMNQFPQHNEPISRLCRY